MVIILYSAFRFVIGHLHFRFAISILCLPIRGCHVQILHKNRIKHSLCLYWRYLYFFTYCFGLVFVFVCLIVCLLACLIVLQNSECPNIRSKFLKCRFYLCSIVKCAVLGGQGTIFRVHTCLTAERATRYIYGVFFLLLLLCFNFYFY